MPNPVSRSTVNKEQYSAPEFSKSGFDMSYDKYGSYLLGRLQASGFQWVMPSDKMSGQNVGNFTFNRLVTPMVSPVDVAQYNFYLPLRAVDKTFERAMVPTKLNAMSASWSAPSFSIREVVRNVLFGFYADGGSTALSNLLKLFGFAYSVSQPNVVKLRDAIKYVAGFDDTTSDVDYYFWLFGEARVSDYNSAPLGWYWSVLSGRNAQNSIPKLLSDMYMKDALADLQEFFESRFGSPFVMNVSLDSLLRDFLYNVLDVFLSPWCGRYSYLSDFGYNYLRPKDIYDLVNHPRPVDPEDITTFLSWFDDTQLNEYPIRVLYVIWYEYFRDVNLEPVSTTLPDWHEFGSASIVAENPCFLLYRFRSWAKDMFISAQIDDISRHVYAPVLDEGTRGMAYHTEEHNNRDTQRSLDSSFNVPKPASYDVSYLDQLEGQEKTVRCPVPTNVNDYLSSLDVDFRDVYGLDLNTLRQAQMLERYLKRNYLFGDEYKDRMLAHYNSRVSDMRVNRPLLLSQSLNGANMEQQVSNVSTEKTNVGDRTATGTLSAGGDVFTNFAEEFGIVVNLITFLPKAQYDGLTPQLLLNKQVDFPLPEFATNNEEFGRKLEIASSGLSVSDTAYMFGRYPAYHAWRSRVDVVGGMFLDELQDCTFRRFWGLDSDDSIPKLNYFFIHCRPNLNMFANKVLYDSQIYGKVHHEFFVERVLPTPVEVI